MLSLWHWRWQQQQQQQLPPSPPLPHHHQRFWVPLGMVSKWNLIADSIVLFSFFSCIFVQLFLLLHRHLDYSFAKAHPVNYSFWFPMDGVCVSVVAKLWLQKQAFIFNINCQWYICSTRTHWIQCSMVLFIVFVR